MMQMRAKEPLPWSRAAFEQKLRDKGAGYHVHHPFNILMNAGKLNPAQIRGWVANRYYYQINIPIKDASVLSNCPDREVRREWIKRIIDHDGTQRDEGGIEAWIRLGSYFLAREATGLSQPDPRLNSALVALRSVVIDDALYPLTPHLPIRAIR